MNANPCLLLNPGRVHAGAGSLAQLPELVAHFRARRVLMLSSKSVAAQVGGVQRSLQAAGVAVTVIGHTPPEPEAAGLWYLPIRATRWNLRCMSKLHH